MRVVCPDLGIIDATGAIWTGVDAPLPSPFLVAVKGFFGGAVESFDGSVKSIGVVREDPCNEPVSSGGGRILEL